MSKDNTWTSPVAREAYDHGYHDGITDGRTKRGPVWILWYTHRHGDDLYTYASEQRARHAMADICRQYWSEVAGEPVAELREMPKQPLADDEEVLRLYFAYKAEEQFTVIESEVG